MNSLLAKANTGEHFYSIKIEDLEKQLDVKNNKIDSLQKELKSQTNELNQQVIKHQNACEARDENKFKVVQLESDMKLLRTENGELKTQLKEQRETKNSRERGLEALVASYDDQLNKYEEKIKAYEAKIDQLETDKNVATSPSEKNLDEKCIRSKECNFKVFQMESDKTVLKQETDNLENRKRKETQSTTIQTLETHTNYTEQIKKCEETIKVCESKVTQVEAEKKEMTCKLDKYIDEIKDLQAQLLSYKDRVLKYEEKLQVERNTNILLQEDLKNLKSLYKKEKLIKNLQPEMRETTDIIGEIGTGAKEILKKLQECENAFASFTEQQKSLRIKFEQEMKLQFAQDSPGKTAKVCDVLGKGSPIKTENEKSAKVCDILEKCSPIKTENVNLEKSAKSKELLVKLGKENEVLPERNPLKPQNKRFQKTVKTEKLESEGTTKTTVASTPHKKNTKKNRKVQDENVHSPPKEKNPASLNGMNVEQHPCPVPARNGRQLRSRKKP